LQDNKLSAEACRYLSSLLYENAHIVSLSLSGCRIGAKGAEKLQNGISVNMTLTTLDLSKCDLGNEGVKYIINALIDNGTIEEINLSHNELDELCTANLGELLLRSTSLKHLDLSWNSLYSAAAWKTLIPAFENNKTLLTLILSWNSLGIECLPHLRKLITDSQSIEKLDLSCKYYTNNTSYRNKYISNI